MPKKKSKPEIPRRPERIGKPKFFDLQPAWEKHWWSMPDFEMGDTRPQYKIVMNFMTAADVTAFKELTGLPITTRSNSAWFPHQKRLKGELCFQGKPTDSRYPVCLPSKGRAECQTTGKVLDELGVSYKFFVEETEGDIYMEHLGEEKVVVMPFHDLGKGSIPARNFIWKWCLEREAKRHWTIDDNIKSFVRVTKNRRLRVYGGGFFQAMEDFVDRYENVVMAGPHNQGFVPDREPNLTPILFNSRIYSCILLDTTLPHRWRGRYNEDTDLSLRLLKDGYCTVLFRALCMHKGTTVGVKGSKPMKGGNTDNVYNTPDHRLAFAKSLQKQHPDVVEVVWRFNRWHHLVDYKPFLKNKPILRAGIVPTACSDEYGMELHEIAPGNESRE